MVNFLAVKHKDAIIHTNLLNLKYLLLTNSHELLEVLKPFESNIEEIALKSFREENRDWIGKQQTKKPHKKYQEKKKTQMNQRLKSLAQY